MSFNIRRTAIIFTILLIATLFLVPGITPVEALTFHSEITIERIEPEIPGLVVEKLKAPLEGLCVTNDTSEETVLLNQGGKEYVKLHPHKQGVAEYFTATGWEEDDKDQKYCLYPGSSSGGPWTVRGRIGEKQFKIVGSSTEWTVPSLSRRGEIILAVSRIGTIICGLLGVGLIIWGFSRQFQHKPAGRYFLFAFLLFLVSACFFLFIIFSEYWSY